MTSASAASAHFNSRPRAGGDEIEGRRLEAEAISIPAPARGATASRPTRAASFKNFNSRPRAGGDAGLLYDYYTLAISIPAPARGATCEQRRRQQPHTISIPAPARGATRSNASPHLRAYFNSRPRAGGDGVDASAMRKKAISIPAPARGATSGRA